jgi:AraC family transcriptional regulator
MEWMESLRRSITFMEEHLFDVIDAYDVADSVSVSPFYFQKGFKLLTGYSIAEYLRYRRLYCAALDMVSGTSKVIDAAYKYGYDTPESFTKAFIRFHGISPVQIRGKIRMVKPFLPLSITLSVQGGSGMDYQIENMGAFKVIGCERFFSVDEGYEKIPQFWSEFMTKYCHSDNSSDPAQAVVSACGIGEFGVCIDDTAEQRKFRYMIAGRYTGCAVPAGMTVYEVPAATWAKFRCVGPLPGALQTVNTEIFRSWLPGNPDYELAGSLNIEWYSMDDGKKPDYESAVWIPVRKK